jgi:hypothetical protein
VIAAQSHNYVEKFFIDKGHTVDRPGEDYGIDLYANTFDGAGYPEAGSIPLQLKASDHLRYSKDRSYISFKVELKHYQYWMKQTMPVFLILYDASDGKAYWLYVQTYFAQGEKPVGSSGTITVRVPTANEFTARVVDYLQARKARMVESEVEHED